MNKPDIKKLEPRNIAALGLSEFDPVNSLDSNEAIATYLSEILAYGDSVLLRSAVTDVVRALKKDTRGARDAIRSDRQILGEMPRRDDPVQRSHYVKEAGILDGIVIRIGGKGNAIPIWLQDCDGIIYKCEASSELARELAQHYLSAPVRVFGQGNWLRAEDGSWSVESFGIHSWEAPDDASIADILDSARLAENGWSEIDDPIREYLLLRGSD
ncbi:hypothetical protein [Massilia sp. BJB1822]|uniref:hypothetical protein n=1 Tax=Massilia sp. BJB1822 TaxID=2744470 RepID=UPI001592F46B|nr:hypothetical protein [Massilia sp. BJB1822]NVD96753.1 hypothetical protein [Massilia sp. BJB1822]